MRLKPIILAGLIFPISLLAQNSETNRVDNARLNHWLRLNDKVNGGMAERAIGYSLREADEKIGNAYGSSLANAGFELSNTRIQRRIIDKRGELPLWNAGIAGLGEALFEKLEIGGDIKEGSFGLRDEYFDWKGKRFNAIATFSEIMSRKEGEKSFAYGVDLLRGDPNFYIKKDIAPLNLSLGARASWEYGEAAVHEYLGKNWRATAGVKGYYALNTGDGRGYFAIQRERVLGGTLVAGWEHRFNSGQQVKEFTGEQMMQKGEHRFMIGLNWSL